MTDEAEPNGMGEIFRTFVRYPAATIQLVTVIGGLFGMYYALEGELHEIKADTAQRYTQTQEKFATLLQADLEEREQIKGLYTRGDTRYTAIIEHLNTQDRRIDVVGTNTEWIMRKLDGDKAPLPAFAR